MRRKAMGVSYVSSMNLLNKIRRIEVCGTSSHAGTFCVDSLCAG